MSPYAPLTSPALTGTPTAPTAASGTNTTQLATTAYVYTLVAASSGSGSSGVTSFNTRTGAVTLTSSDVTTALTYTPAASAGSNAQTFNVASPTASANAVSLNYLQNSYAPLASPALTGTPTAPTASVGTNTTQLATTAFVLSEFATPPSLGSTTPNSVSATTLTASSTVSGAGFTTLLSLYFIILQEVFVISITLHSLL